VFFFSALVANKGNSIIVETSALPWAVMSSTAVHVTPFLLVEITVQQWIVYVRAGILKTIMIVRLFTIELIMLKRDILHISHEFFSVQDIDTVINFACSF